MTSDGPNEAPHTQDRPVKALVVYGTMFGATELVAEKVSQALAAEFGVDVACRDAGWLDFAELADVDLLVIGSCTWNIGQLPSDWELRLDDLGALDLHGKAVALFGTGDRRGYPDTFLDALDTIAQALEPTGATLIGEWSTAGYVFTGSLALRGDNFVGLALDEDNDADLTDARVAAWCAQLRHELSELACEGARTGPGAPSREHAPGAALGHAY